MISTSVDIKELVNILKNTTNYSKGFVSGAEMNKLEFNRILGGYTAEALKNYIDSKARMNPESLHHVYEWDSVGNLSSRLFDFNVVTKVNSINFSGKFLPSKTPSPNSDDVFSDKANIMENRIGITIEPRNSDILAFEDDGETIFVATSIYIANPGGDAVAGSFGKVVSEFFDKYFTASILQGILKDLATPEEFVQYFAQGSKSGRSVGVKAGRKYFSVKGVDLI